MNIPEKPLGPDFREQAKANDVPVARLIGFEAKDIAGGRATVVLAAGSQHANPHGDLQGGILCDIADAAMGLAFASTLAAHESFTTVELENKFLSSGLAGTAESRRNCRTAGPHDRLHGVQSDGRGKPSGGESGIHLHGFSGPARHRTIISTQVSKVVWDAHCPTLPILPRPLPERLCL